MKILVISQEVWRDDQNGGNVLSNIFKHFDEMAKDNEKVEFAQIYCSEGIPQNKICKKYYQMTDRMVLANVLDRRKKIGKNFELSGLENCSEVSVESNSFSKLKKMRWEIFLVAKEILWKISSWQNEGIKSFVKEFNPDIIFAPSYGWHYMQKLTRVIKSWTGKPVISYISDDFYSCKQFRFSPVYWINHILLRKSIRKTFTCYDLVYTMTEEQKKECEKAFGANMKILCKSADFEKVPKKETVNSPIRFVYAGNMYLKRWETLEHLAKAMRKINENGVKMVLDIYSNTVLDKKQFEYLNDGINSKLRSVVSQDELKKIYSESDVALHVESFGLKNRLAVRLSFSTKIIDCLASGCAVMAICHPSQSGYAYLKNNDIALCCENLNELGGMLNNIAEHPDILCDIQKKAIGFGRINHDENTIAKELCEDFYKILSDDFAN